MYRQGVLQKRHRRTAVILISSKAKLALSNRCHCQWQPGQLCQGDIVGWEQPGQLYPGDIVGWGQPRQLYQGDIVGWGQPGQLIRLCCQSVRDCAPDPEDEICYNIPFSIFQCYMWFSKTVMPVDSRSQRVIWWILFCLFMTFVR